MADTLLEVRVLHPADTEAAEAGGADRLLVAALGESRAHSPEPGLVSAIARSSELPVRALLRLPDSGGRDTATGADLVRMIGLAQAYAAAGADGVTAGFLTDQLEVDVELSTALAEQLPFSWTFSRAIDSALDHRRAWRAVVGLPGVDAVLAAGSPLGAAQGYDVLLEMAQDRRVADLLVAAGGVHAEHVPWLLRAGVQGVHLGSSVRPGRSWVKANVDTALVRSWRLLVDDELARRRSRPTAPR